MDQPASGATAELRSHPEGSDGWLSRRRQRLRARRKERWSRPKPPHDWRWAVGGLGRTLIIVGLLMFGFVAYQLWGTAIQTAQAQSRLKDEFREQLASTDPGPDTTGAGTTTLPASTTTAPVPESGPATTVTAPTTAAPVETSPGPADTAGEPPSIGDPIALIDAPDMDVDDWAVIEGVGTDELSDGIGHFPDTPLPGELGNAVLAGHRTSHGAPFLDIDDLQVDDRIELSTFGGTFVYAVTGTEIVEPSQADRVVPTNDPTRATLTLVSCHPAYTIRQRYIVRAELVVALSDTPVAPTSATVPPTQVTEVPSESMPVSTPTTGSVTATDGAPEDTAPAPPGTSAGESELFSDGWFSDGAAWPHVIGWGLLVTAIAIGGWWLCRRFQRYSVGIVAAAVPFVVALYFWYENISRLLPPGF